MAIESPLLMETLANIQRDIREGRSETNDLKLLINEKFDELAVQREKDRAAILERLVTVEKDVVRVKTVWTTIIAVVGFLGSFLSSLLKGG